MDIAKYDTLLHNTTRTVYQVRSFTKHPGGRPHTVKLYNYSTKDVEEYFVDALDQHFTKIDKDLASDIAEMGKVGPADFDNLQAVRQEYREWLSQFSGGIPPKHDQPYTNEEIRTVIQTSDNLIEMYQLAMNLERTLTGLRYVVDKARTPGEPGKWKSWSKYGVPGDASFWQVQTVVKDMGGVYNPLLDTRPELQVRL